MTLPLLVPLLPLLLPAAATVLLMLLIAIRRHHGAAALLSLAGLAAGFVAIPLTASAEPRQVTPLLRFDGYALFFLGLVLATSFVVVILSHGYLARQRGRREELYVELLAATVGAGTLVASTHFASFFLGLEILSVSLYTLVAYRRDTERGIEAGVKYLVLAASSAAFLLFGLALLYMRTGTMALATLVPRLSDARLDAVVLAGLALVTVGIGFKLALVPFHLWTPDVFEGSPAPVTAFVATVSKGAMFALLFRYFARVDAPSFRVVIMVMAVASMLVGNLLALRQDNLKRLLGYSSIAHLGYLLVGFIAGATMAVSLYLVAYFATTLAAFGVLCAMSGPERDLDTLADYRGLAWRRPWMAGALTLSMLSLAGIPLTAGFLGKFYVIAAGAGSGLWAVLLVLVAGSAIGLYYYLRVVVVLFLAAEATAPAAAPELQPVHLVLGMLMIAILWIGIFPQELLSLIATGQLP